MKSEVTKYEMRNKITIWIIKVWDENSYRRRHEYARGGTLVCELLKRMQPLNKGAVVLQWNKGESLKVVCIYGLEWITIMQFGGSILSPFQNQVK